jgi:hypothetical protein
MTNHIRFAAVFATSLFLCLAFATLLAADGAVAPFQITSHDPSVHEIGVTLSANVYADCDDDVNAATLNNDTFVVHGHLGGLASGSFSYDAGNRRVRLDPSRTFHAGEVLRVSATDGILSTGGTPLTAYGWQFTAGLTYGRPFAGFVKVAAGLPAMDSGSVAWGDYDNDGDLDILLTGNDGTDPRSKLYRNDGGTAAPVFALTLNDLTGVQDGSVAWGDYDNDGDLDILLTGWDGSADVSKLYRNDGALGFSEVAAGLDGVSASSVAWGDVDNDGDLDILLTGSNAGTRVSKVYRNDGGGVFAGGSAGLTAVWRSSVAWGDFDNDGDLDILLAGATGGYPITNPVSKVYRNDGAGVFTDIGAALVAVDQCSLAWGDMDGDSDLDIVLTGRDSSHIRVSRVYRNDGVSGFADTGAALTGVELGEVAWGDVDSDGDLDILLTGRDSSSNPVSAVYRNDGAGGFAAISSGLTGVQWSSAAWGDYDKDNDLDVLLTGFDGISHTSTLYRSNSKPGIDGVAPSDGSAPVATTVYFTTTWNDPDGAEDLKQCYFHIGDSPSLAGNVTLLYNAAKDKLWLRNDAGTGWVGGHAPRSANVMDNSQARVYCADTRVRRTGSRLEVRWAIRFSSGFAGAKKLGMKAKDIYKVRAKAAWMGRWTITP